MRIIKFGGTSVGSPEALKQVKYIVGKWLNPAETKAVVVSAFSGVTNQLIEMARLADKGNHSYQLIYKSLKERHIKSIEDLFEGESKIQITLEIESLFEELNSILYGIFLVKECSARTLDLVMSFGEQFSARILTGYLHSCGISVHYLDARTLIQTDSRFGNAHLKKEETFANLKKYFAASQSIAIVTGFVGSTENGETTTLGRGGSDYTASILAAGIRADEIVIYTDVNGMMTADPRVVKNAFTLPQISYEEAMELSHFGAKVIYPPTLQPAIDQNIPIRICNTFDLTNPGTIIQEASNGNPYLITGLSSIQNINLVNIQGSGLIGVAGISGRLFSALAHEQISVILITQASSEHSISFAIGSSDAQKAKIAIERAFALELKEGNLNPIDIQSDVAIVAIIGENMKRTPGVSGKIFGALGRNGINVMATAQGSSELNISIVISQNDVAKTLNALHEEFFTSDLKRLHIFMVGPGLIGKTLLSQLSNQLEFLKKQLLLDIRLVGLANSRQMLVDRDGIDLVSWEELVKEKGEPTELGVFSSKMIGLNLPNSVVVDCTSTDLYIPYYQGALQKSIAVVTPNKLANSASFAQYKSLRDTAIAHNTRFCYETNVGAGLPVIQTLKNLIQSGDQIFRIEAMLSGTLSYIFNRFKPGIPFWEVVMEAKNLGYTEPDPRDDLSGKDISRKILILARETGLELEPSEVMPENFLPNSCLKAASVDDFFTELKNENSFFENMAKTAENEGKKIKFICKLEKGSVQVKLEKIGSDHPFWNSSGADNILAFYSTRYSQRPLVIQGPGAGAEVTAAGVFAEIISLG